MTTKENPASWAGPSRTNSTHNMLFGLLDNKTEDDYSGLPYQYFDSLDDSLLFDCYRVSDHAEVLRARDRVWNTLSKKFRARNREDKKSALTSMLCNLSESIQQQKPIAISRNKNDHKAIARYGGLFMKPSIILGLLDELIAQDWIVQKKGFIDRSPGGKSRMTRIWATSKMGDALFSVDPVQDIHKEFPELVILKDEDGKQVDYRDTSFTNELRQDLRKFNCLLSQSEVTYSPEVKFEVQSNHHPFWSLRPSSSYPPLSYLPPSIPTYLLPSHSLLSQQEVKPLIDSHLCCKFSNGRFDHHGRFYSLGKGWQNLKQEERKTIQIDGCDTVELDFSSLHPHIAYAEAGIQLVEDPYLAVCDNRELRGLLKFLVLTAFNAVSLESAIQAVEWELTKLRHKSDLDDRERALLKAVGRHKPDIERLLRKLPQVHAPIADRFYTQACFRLMNRDAAIMRDVLTHFTNRGIVCLPVHDSAIVPIQYEDELRQVMEEAYSRQFPDFSCPVDRK